MKEKYGQIHKKWEISFNVMLLFSTVIIVLLSIMSHYFPYIGIYNSDSLYSYDVARDIVFYNGSPYNWFPPQYNLYFPDMVLAGVSFLFTRDVYYGMIIISFLQVSIVFFSFFFISSQIDNKKTLRNSLTVTTAIIILLIWTALLPADRFAHKAFVHVFQYMFVLSWHYGSFLALLIYTCLSLKLIGANSSKGKVVICISMLFLSYISALSDRLFFIQATFPFLFGYIVWCFFRKKFDLFIFLTFLLSTIISHIGAESSYYLGLNPIHHKPQWDFDFWVTNFLPRLQRFFEMTRDTIYGAPHFAVFLFIYFFCIIHSIYRTIVKKDMPETEEKLSFLMIFSFLSIVTLIAVQLIVSPLPTADRWSYPFFFFPLGLPILYFFHFFVKQSYVIIAQCAMFILVLQTGYSLSQHVTYSNIIYNPLGEGATCMDEVLGESSQIRYGFTDYWSIRPFQLMSKYPLLIANFDLNELREVRWEVNKRSYREKYDFAIIDNRHEGSLPGLTTEQKLIKRSGRPIREKVCNGALVMVYEPGGLTVSPPKLSDDYTVFSGCDLIRFDGHINDQCVINFDKKSHHVHLSLLELNLPIGKYSIEVDFSSNSDESTMVGNWEIIRVKTDNKTKQEISAKQDLNKLLYGSRGKRITSITDYEVSQKERFEKTFLRVFVEPNNQFTQYNVVIKRK